MRLSVNPQDPGYRAWRAIQRRDIKPVVTINGIEIKHCVTVDTKRGAVTVHDIDHNGAAQLNSKRDAVRLKRMFGDVRIELRRPE